MTIAIIVGHKETAKGAHNPDFNISEFDFNKQLARDIVNECKEDIIIVYRNTYKSLPGDVNAKNPDFIISLHCNAFNRKATGTETLYYYKSSKGKKLADIFQKKIVDALGLADRGVKSKTAEDRGGYLLRYTNAPCLICEPFFIDCLTDFETARYRYKELVEAYARGIEEGKSIL